MMMLELYRCYRFSAVALRGKRVGSERLKATARERWTVEGNVVGLSLTLN